MGLETLLIIIGVLCKWVLHPNVVQHQQAIGDWCFGLGLALVALELLVVLFIVMFDTRR